MINRAIALCCCLFLSTVSFAQGGKLIKQTLQTGTKEGLAAQAGKQILPKMPAKVGQGAGTTSVAPKAGLRNAPRAAVSAQAGTPKERTPESFAQESPFPVFDQKALDFAKPLAGRSSFCYAVIKPTQKGNRYEKYAEYPLQ